MKDYIKHFLFGILCCATLVLTAQNKDIDKGKEILAKAMAEKDNAKSGELVTKARELLMKGGLKSPQISELLGNAYLEKKDFTRAASSFSAAGKEERKVGFKKLAYLQLEDAFATTDPKMEAKTLRAAMSAFTKADALAEGSRAAGDKYYDKGQIDNALVYYIQADAKDKIEKVATDYKAKGDDIKAAETYLLAKNENGYKSAGDIYFAKKDYERAFDAYYNGKITEGLIKYANQLLASGKTEEGEQMFGKVAEAYINKDDKASVLKMAEEQLKKNNFNLATTLFDKAGEDVKANKYRAYTKVMEFSFDEAKTLLEANGEASLANAITTNMKFLSPLANCNYTLDEIKKAEPQIDYSTDESGNRTANKADVQALETYYKTSKDAIVGELYKVSANVSKISDPELKNLMRLRFLKYQATGKVLNPESFAIKLQKPQVSFKDAIL
ncbi:MAG: hypothetical protein M9931_03630 [Chitinophagales bacterium]|nr:hypothetical protein [Chitinophagales bacterium]OJV27203.1 MAG: hypothetical protein BGO32_04875 [Bacteroidetes bacterium 37-13]HRP39729.1 hypothetical protein [Chitinophagales bacterium]